MKTLISTLSLALLCMPAFAGGQPDRDVVRRWDAGAWTVWRIDRPALTGPVRALEPISLRAGDIVVLTAGGCTGAAAGDSGMPLTEVASLAIPGTTRGPEPLGQLLDREIELSGPVVGLELAFEAAAPASSLGETSSVAGCSGEGYILIATRAPRGAPPAPMDLVGTAAREVNGISMNPRWGSQVTSGTLGDPVACFDLPGWFGNPACTGQPTTIDEGSGLNAIICEIGSTTPIAGHVNWRPGTYAGPVYWDHHSIGDSDYNMKIPPVDGNGLTLANTTYIKGEFDSRETVDNFSAPWWTAFRDASDSSKQAMVDGKETIMIGLVGTDCEHDCESEIHPVWGLAIHVKDDPNDDVWAVFARNWGNEGFCSSLQHLVALPGNRLSFRLPWRRGTGNVATAGGTVFYANENGMSYGVGVDRGKAVTLTVQLLPPDQYGRVHGELHLRWTPVPSANAASSAAAPVARPVLTAEVDAEKRKEENVKAERWLRRIVASMDETQRASLRAELAALAPARSGDRAAVSEVPMEALAAEISDAAVTTVPDGVSAASNSSRVLAIRRAYGKKLPGPRGDAVEKAYLEGTR